MTTLAQALLTLLLNACWQVALVAAFAILGDWLLRDVAARIRHALWVSALILAFLIPLLSCTYLLKSSSLAVTAPIKTSSGPVIQSRIISSEIERAEASPEISAPIEPARRNFWSAAMPVSERLARTLTILSALFFLYRIASLLRAWRRTRLIVKTAYEFQFLADAGEVMRRCQKSIGVNSVQVLASASVVVPIAVGVFRPLIVLPERLLHQVEGELLTTAIGHELVHIARRDYLCNLIYEFIYLPLSFHPAAALIRRRIKHTRELSCDEAVAEKLLGPQVYARSLVRLIGAMPHMRQLADTTIGISESDNLEVRIMSLLRARNLAPRRKILLLVIVALLLAVPCVAASRFAVAFEIARPAPQRPVDSPLSEQKLERQKLEQARSELKRVEQQLKEQLKTAPEGIRFEAEMRLREVQQNLEIHNQLLLALSQQKEDENKRVLEKLREAFERVKKEQPADDAQLKALRDQLVAAEKLDSALQAEMRDRIAKILNQTKDEAQLRELQQKLAELSIQDQAERVRNREREKEERAIGQQREAEQRALDQNREMAERARTQEREAEERVKAQENELKARMRNQEREDGERERTRDSDYRGAGLAAAGWAKISMTQAIQIATSKYPGTVVQSRLMGEREDKVFYQIIIAVGEGDKRTVRYVWVSAIDGRLLKTE